MRIRRRVRRGTPAQPLSRLHARRTLDKLGNDVVGSRRARWMGRCTSSSTWQIIKEEKAKLLNEFRIPRGFIRISKPSDVNFLLKQERDGTIGPMQWNINNGVIVIIPETGARHASVYVTERAGGREDARRTTPEAEARASLDTEGYKRNTNIYVPLSNPGFEN